MMLRIGTFSRRGRVSVKALRHYEAVGLLKPAHVDGASGYRYYEPSQLDDLHRLMVLRALGLPLERIRVLLQDDPSPELMRHLLAERRASVARRIDAERAQLAAIEARARPMTSCCATCRRRWWRVCAEWCRTMAPSNRCSTKSPEHCPRLRVSPATAPCGTTAPRTSSRSTARRWCFSSGRSPPRAA